MRTVVRELEERLVPLLRNCANVMELKKIHARIINFSLSQSSFLATMMIDVCDEKGDTDYANLLFKQIVEPNLYLYNAMIRSHAHNHKYIAAIHFYQQMCTATDPQTQTRLFADRFTFPFVIKSCAGLSWPLLGRQVHAHLSKFGPKSNIKVNNSLVDMYAKLDCLEEARRVFDEMSERDVISWNSVIFSHVRLGQMRKARALFEEMSERTIVSWTAIISGYARSGAYSDALEVFREMQMIGIKPDEISVVAVLPACAHLGALEVGKWIHFYADRNGFLQKTYICNALIEMYAKCGNIEQALWLFDQMPNRDVISWSTVIAGLANHGRAREAIEVFHGMQHAKVQPNAVTFLGVLSACAHAGLWNEGLSYFSSMRKNYHIEPEIEHYGCLIDLLGRSGCLDHALRVVKEMPVKPDAAIWGSLLSSCKMHRNLEIALVAMDFLQQLEPDDTGNFVLLSNIFADHGKWNGVAETRKLMKSKSMKKTPGCSSVEVDGKVEEFVSGEDSKPFSQDLYKMLELLAWHQSIAKDVINTTVKNSSGPV